MPTPRCRPGAPVQEARTFWPCWRKLALGTDVSVERHRADPEFPAQRGHGRVAVGHRSLGQPHLGLRQRELPATLAPAGSRSLEPGPGAFPDQLPLELGERREDADGPTGPARC